MRNRPSIMPVSGAYNFRDLGGLRTNDGRMIRPGRLFRSDSIHELTESDVEWLATTIGLSGVVDLREAGEISTTGRGLLEKIPEIAYANVPMCVDRFEGVDPDELLGAIYVGFLAQSSGLSSALERVAQFIVNPTIFHCAAGKDRTGVLAATVLAVAGVPEEAIVADYMLSKANMPRVLERFSRWPYYESYLRSVPPQVSAVEERAIRRFLKEMRVGYGDARGWASASGVSKTVLQRLERELVITA